MGQVGHGGVDRAFSSEAPGPGFERPTTPSKKTTSLPEAK